MDLDLALHAAADAYLASFGWGVEGKHLNIGRMLTDKDVPFLSRGRFFTAVRPRGLLSGFLAIVPRHPAVAVVLPNPMTRMKPFGVRLRLSDAVRQNGALFSVYITKDRELVLEDVLVWNQASVWTTKTFEDRWAVLNSFFSENFKQDILLQGNYTLRPAKYGCLECSVPAPGTVLEFVPNAPGQKRLIWLVPAAAAAHGATSTASDTSAATAAVVAKKDPVAGPDVYGLWRNGTERLGQALVRTLSVSRALRLSQQTEIPVRVVWNDQFQKMEILAVL